MLERLYLHNNNLGGNVPDWLSELKNLKELRIENNNFSGVIPVQLLNRSLKLNYSGNPYLCMHKGECILQNSNKNNIKLKVVLGTTLSGILIIALALIAGTIVYRNKLRRKEPKPFLCQDYSMIVVPNPTKSRAFTLDEVMAATQTFSCEIGRGGFGSVFFGKLPEGNDIAVKVLSSFSQQGVKEFLNEVDLLSKINHRNLVSLLGYCNESRELMLIYEHMSGGSLRDHLYGARAEHSELNWKTRLKITLDAAQGLEYLHVGSTPKIIHRDVKTANILLDNNLNGKLADFGLSRMTMEEGVTHVTTAVKGTFGYVDPEYFITQMLTEKSDVYSFGVVLLEIVCGRQPIDVKLPTEEVNMIRWVTPYVLKMDENPGKIAEIIDKRLHGNYDMKSINLVAKVAMRCVQAEPCFRPSVSEVVVELKNAMKHEDKASISISEQIDIGADDLLAGPIYLSVDSSEPKGMEWSDNSANISKMGR
jgi:serine/threonine protein kinase